VATSPTGAFNNLHSGTYWVTVIDQIGCGYSTLMVVDRLSGWISPMVDTVLCNLTLQVFGVLSYTGSNWSANSGDIDF